MRLTVMIAVVLLATAKVALATSAVSCLNRGIELRADFTVEVTHANKPLPGVSVEVKGSSESVGRLYSETTGGDGRVWFKKLPAGDYWVKVEFLGIGAGYECFHVNGTPSSGAKKRRRYEWGDMPVGVRQASGRLVDSKPGNDGTPIERLIRRIDVPVVGAQLELHQPFDGTTYRTVTDSTGFFLFEGVPDGTYVLQIVGVRSSIDSPPDSNYFLISVGKGAKVGNLLLRKDEPSIGGAIGTSIQIEVGSSPKS